MYEPHPGISLQAADVYSFRCYVAAAAMRRYLIGSLEGSRAEKKKESPLILSDCLHTARIVKFAHVIRLLMCIKVAVPFYNRF